MTVPPSTDPSDLYSPDETPAGQQNDGTFRGHSAEAPREDRPQAPPGREVNAMTSSRQLPELDRYLARRGFRPHPSHSAWLDRDTGPQIIRVLHEPGEATLLYCRTWAGASSSSFWRC